MTRCCATCGRPFFSMPLPDLDLLDAVRLSPMERAVLDVLVAAFPRRASADRFIEDAWEARGVAPPEQAYRSLLVHLSRVRKSLAGCGFGIEAHNEQGWRLVRLADTQREAA